ncbi:Uma2 family endonuclease [soil metagenome]
MTIALKTRMTAVQFLRKYGDKSGFELDRGHLVRLPMPGFEHGNITCTVSALLREFVKAKDIGRVASQDTFIRLRSNPSSFRGPDVLFISYKLLPKSAKRPKGPLEVMPELVIEVRSPTDRLKVVTDKGREYLDAGVKVVIIIDPETESLGVFRDEELPQRFHNGDTVTIPDVLPGFSAPVKAFFE